MVDSSNYPFRLLEFLKMENKYDKEGGDYAKYLLTMYKATSIDDIVTIYNKVFEKISYYVFYRSFPIHWFLTDSWGKKKYLVYELNKCLNENIKRLYVSLENPTKEDCVSCIVNLRESDNKKPIQNAIFLHNQFESINEPNIIGLREKSYMIRKKIRSMCPGNVGYYELVDEYDEIMNELKSLGYKYTIEEKKIEEMRSINVEEWVKRKEESVKLKNEKKRKDKIINIILVVLLMIPLLFIIYLYFKIKLIGIIIIIGFLGAIPKILLKGKL